MPKRYLFTLLIIAIVLFGLLGLGIRTLTRGGDNAKKPETSQNQPKPRDFVKETNTVSYTIQGKLVGEEERRAVRITITQTERKAEILQGYDEAVIKTQVAANKQSAYDTFLRALVTAGFNNSNKNVNSDERGSCPNGRRFIYTANFSDQTKYRSWGASCSKAGSFLGNKEIIRSLFENQIPEFDTFIRGTKLG